MGDTGTAYQVYVGIDIAADTFTAAWRTLTGVPGHDMGELTHFR